MEALTKYPPYQYIYQASPNPLEQIILTAVAQNGRELAEVRNTPFKRSLEAEKILVSDLQQAGLAHSVTNKKVDGLFNKGINFEVDFFHCELGVAIEVEKGEVNNIWKNICKFGESPLIRHGVLLVPIVRQGQRNASEYYHNTVKRLHCLVNIFSLIDSLLVIGY